MNGTPSTACGQDDRAEIRERFRTMLAKDHPALLREVTSLVDRNYDSQIPPPRISQIKEWVADPKTVGLPAKLVLTLGVYVYGLQAGEITAIFKQLPIDQQQMLDAEIAILAKDCSEYWC